MTQWFNRLMLLALLLTVSACWRPSNAYDLPYKAPENAPPEYKVGWEHGCKSGFSAYGNNYYKTLYKFTQDVERMNDPTYSKAWTDSFHYCRAYINRLLAGYAFKGPQGDDNYAIFSTTRLNFLRPTQDMRDKAAVSKDALASGGPWSGVNTPGWGQTGWGANVKCKQDWLGAKPSDCGWMGVKEGGRKGDMTFFGVGTAAGTFDTFLYGSPGR